MGDMEMGLILCGRHNLEILSQCECVGATVTSACRQVCTVHKTHMSVYTTRRLQWDRYRLLNETCNKDKKDTVQKKIIIVGAHLTSPTAPLKSGVHLFAALENSLDRRIGVFQCRSSILPRQRVSPCLSIPLLLDTL